MSMKPNALEMSDEDFMKADPSQFGGSTESKSTTAPETADANDAPAGEEEEAEDTATAGQAPAAEAGGDDEGQAAKEAEGQDPQAQAADPKAQKAEKAADDSAADAAKDPEKKPGDAGAELSESQYAAIGKQIMGEFKANGATLKMKSAEDAIRLMQMGANYHKKMNGLKPALKALKLLENHGLMDPQKINYLIDLSQKKPEAITQLLKESKIDPMEIDLEGESKYTPGNRTVSDTELQLDEVLDSISSSPVYNRTLTVIGDQWDETSRAVIAKDPEIIRTINLHMENGIFDQVANAIAYERSLGKLAGVSDFDAYQRIGTYMNENNLFKVSAAAAAPSNPNHQAPQSPTGRSEAKAKEIQARKQAASPSQQRQSPAKEDTNYNPLAMSDEEFLKLNKLNL